MVIQKKKKIKNMIDSKGRARETGRFKYAKGLQVPVLSILSEIVAVFRYCS
jgi:hypothetical protein